MSLRVAGQLLARAAVAQPALRRRIHSSHSFAASASPFTEPTSPNPTLEKYAETTSALHTYGSYLTQCLPKFIQQFSVMKDELTLYTAPATLVSLMTFLRDHSQCQFKYLMHVTAVDFPERDKRFEVVYHLLSTNSQGRIRVKTYAGEGDHVPSVTDLFRSADWCVVVRSAVFLLRQRRYEREVWDMYGVFFSGHPDLYVLRSMSMSDELNLLLGVGFSLTTVCFTLLFYFF